MPVITPAPPGAPPFVVRKALIAVFAVLGALMAVWGARLPAVRSAAHLSNGQLALVLLGAAVGMVAGLQAGGRLAHRYGPACLIGAPMIGLSLALAALGQSQSLLALTMVAVAFGVVHGLLDVGANTAAISCQNAYGRPIMSGLHAAYSLGALVGAGLAAATASFSHASVFLHFGAAGIVAALLINPFLKTSPSLLAPPSDSPDSPGVPLPRTTVWLLGALAAACLLAEGVAADWSALHLISLGANEAQAAAAYALYSAAMAAGRLVGDRLTSHYGAPALVRSGAGLAAAGLTTGLITGTVWAAYAGWLLLGLGLSIVVPLLITAAGQGGPRSVGTVAATGYVGLIAGPAVIGGLASHIGLSASLFLPALLAGAVALASRRALESR